MNTETVREIQKALRLLSFSEPALPRLVVDGRFGHETKRAVSIFQELYRLPITGEVDPVTWDRLQEAYQDAITVKPRPLAVFPHEKFLLRLGDKHESVPVIKHILNTLSARYGNLPSVGNGDIYDPDTANAVRRLRQLHDLEDNDTTDIDVWELLVSLYEHPFDADGSDVD